MRGRKRAVVLIGCALTLTLGALSQGCMVRKDRVEMGPFYYKRDFPETQETEAAILWPFLQEYRSPRVHQLALRPLVNVRWEDPGEEEGITYEIQGIWPVFLHRRTTGPTRLRTRVLPVFNHVRFHHPDGNVETDTAIYPFFLWGSSDEGEDYFAFFPVAGRIRGLFGQDRIRFLLFPFYADTQKGEHRAWHFLWPFVKWSKGGGKSAFRIWPFVGWKQKENRYRKFFLLWPFFARVQNRLGSERPTDSWFFLPFYGRQQTPFGKVRYYLYPFFSYQRNERPGNRFREWRIPWPLLTIARGDRIRQTEVWPFWGRKRRVGTRSSFALYPIYRSYTAWSRVHVSRRRYVLPLYWSYTQTDAQGVLRQRRVKGFPLVDYSVGGPWRKRVRVISPLWFWRPFGGFERNYSDFWTLYSFQENHQGKRRTKVLWYPWYRSPEDLPAGTEAETIRPEDVFDEPIETPAPGPRRPAGSGSPWYRQLLDPLQELYTP